MAIRSMTVLYMVLLLVALASVMGISSKCGNGSPCMVAVAAAPANNQIRKLLLNGEEEDEELFKGGGFGTLDSRHGKDVVSWDLRKAPSGPDPLHHNGGSPKKPRTP
ncbi:uncharacterized protein LOC122057583 [Macadamia integrifolia]|uniref:uncharacterized protein LOC122057583 n=1 Tax=Macadamia integrifolia TaxID=60698 RepID=UPI001C52F5C7|nr:uncharacterized protein LOC122057583 [Macadamia integrifolia]